MFFLLQCKSEHQSVDNIRSKAEQGDAMAQYTLAGMYAQGQGVPQDYAEAARWCKKAAEQGNAKAQLNLSSMYYLNFARKRQ